MSVEKLQISLMKIKSIMNYWKNAITKQSNRYNWIQKRTFLEESYVKFCPDIELIKNQIDILYLNNSAIKEIHRHLCDDDECFWILGVNLFTVDLENLRKTAHTLNYSFDAKYSKVSTLRSSKIENFSN